jgi:hypothetical protein
MHTLMLIAAGFVALAVFLLAAVLLGRSLADGARVFIFPWLVAALVNMGVGLYWANIPLSVEIPVLLVVFGIPAGVAWLLARRYRVRT